MSLTLYAIAPNGEKYDVELTTDDNLETVLQKICDASGYTPGKIALEDGVTVQDLLLTEMDGEFKFTAKWKPTREEAEREVLGRRLSTGHAAILEHARNGDIHTLKVVYIADPIPFVRLASALIASHNIAVLDILIRLGEDVNCTDFDKETALGYVTLGVGDAPSSCSVVDTLVQMGANVNHHGSRARTPAHYSARKGDSEMLRRLASYGADLNALCDDSETPLHYAARCGKGDAVQTLLSLGAAPSLNAQCIAGKTALHVTGRSLSTPCYDILVEHHADVNIVDKNKRTPLHIAAMEGNLVAVTAFLSLPREVLSGFDMQAKDCNGLSALSHAMPYPEVFRAMIASGLVKATGSDIFRAIRLGHVGKTVACLTKVF